jgi:predicted dinucleotide-binding enzyme
MDGSIKGGTMKVGVLGTGMVGRTIATKLVELGHTVTMGSRSADGEALQDWLSEGGREASGGTFADAASSAELVFNCTAGFASLEALAAAGAGSLSGKTLVDVANPLDFSHGMPPLLLVCNDDSLGERIQAAYPEARVVKALNTINHLVMTDPGRVPGDHDVFICGNEDGAKAEVTALLESFGWPGDSILDLGDITAARGTEMYLPLWLRLYGTLGTGDLNIKVQRAT